MKIGMTLPVTEPGWNRDILLRWVEKIDRGPFSTLALGERIAFVNPEIMTTLGACAALTQRVRLMTTVIVLPMHDAVLCAKQLATASLFSEGRLSVGVGLGGREEDYLAIGADFSKRRLDELQRRVETMRCVWNGDIVVEGLRRPVEPFPPALPPILAGVLGPKGIAHAARWADGISGFSFAASATEAALTVTQAHKAWQQAQREKAPYVISSFWYALDIAGAKQTARERKDAHLRRYLNWFEGKEVEAMLPHTGFAGSATQLKQRIGEIAATGVDELLLVPTSIDPEEVDRVSDLLT